MSDYGTLTDYSTGTPIRPATVQEWRQTAGAIAAGKPEGIFADQDGTVVWVDGGPEAEVSDTDIAGLESEAATAGDAPVVEACQTALGEPLTLSAISGTATYRVAGLGTDLIAFFASTAHDLAVNGLKVAADGDDMLISGAGVAFLAGRMTADDDGWIEGGSLWAAGDPYPVTRDGLTPDEARAACICSVLDARAELAA
jgi:hypothetical protein